MSSAKPNETRSQNEAIAAIANDDWPTMEGLGKSRFVVKTKKKDADIETTSKTFQQIGEEEDHIISNQNVEDEQRVNQMLHPNTHLPPSEENVEQKPVASNINPVVNEVKHIINEVKPVINESKPSVNEVKPIINESINTVKREAIEQPVRKQVIENTTVNKQINTTLSKENNTSQDKNVLIKFALLGLAQLYLKKTNFLLNPLRFIAENWKKVLVASIHLGVPLLMTWYAITQVPMVSQQFANENKFFSVMYAGIFYFAAIFIWFTIQALCSGLLVVFKKTFTDVAKIGEQSTKEK